MTYMIYMIYMILLLPSSSRSSLGDAAKRVTMEMPCHRPLP